MRAPVPGFRGSLPITRRLRLGLATFAIGAALAACGQANAAPTGPADFTTVAASLASHGIVIDHVVSGEAGCSDLTLARTAISFDASGVDQKTPVRVHLYTFRDGSVYTRLRGEVDQCAQAYVTDGARYAVVDTSPYVAAGKGPWGPRFTSELRAALDGAVPQTDTGM